MAELNSRHDIERITDEVRRSKVRWFGHVERTDNDDCISACRSFEVEGVRVEAGIGRLGVSA